MKQKSLVLYGKEKLQLESAFQKKELRVTGSSDGWDYQKHSRWFFQHVSKTPYIEELFQYEIHQEDMISCFNDLNKGVINPLKVLVRYRGCRF